MYTPDVTAFSSAISPVNTGDGAESGKTNSDALREVARDFEAVLTAAIFKESLRASGQIAEKEGSGGTEGYRELAWQQLAYHIGRQGILGIADRIVADFEQLEERGNNGQRTG